MNGPKRRGTRSVTDFDDPHQPLNLSLLHSKHTGRSQHNPTLHNLKESSRNEGRLLHPYMSIVAAGPQKMLMTLTASQVRIIAELQA